MTPAARFNPYPGLRPFRESEAHLFFGRASHVDEVLAELSRSRFVAVMGASGSGKSSLVAAGLLPALRSGFSPRAGSHWRLATFRPGAKSIHNLARVLSDPAVLGANDPDPLIATAQTEAILRRSAFGLADAARRSAAVGDGRVLVVVDQFEELFRFSGAGPDTAGDGDAEPFVQVLLEAARDPEAPVDVVITMRSDFLGDCSRFRDLPEAINRGLYLVPRLTRSQLSDAITGPAAVGGAAIAPRLVQRILNDAGADPDLLPVVQHALMRTWDIWVDGGGPASGPIDLAHYEASGGLESALSRHADEAYFALAEGRQQHIAELMFKRITELGDDQREVRRPTALAEIAEVAEASADEVETCLRHFEGQGRSFVTLSADGVVDISHESLIRQWPRLRAWVREEAESRDQYRQLAGGARRWQQGAAGLLRDPELELSSRWWREQQPNQPWASRYDPAFESAARYLDRSRRAARRRRVVAAAGVVTLAVLAVVAALLAVWANDQEAQAQEQRRTAVARQLAASAVEAGPAHRPLSILAAVQALRTTERDGHRLAAAEEALRGAMRSPMGVPLSSGETPPAEVNPVSVAASPDGSTLATGGGDGRVRLWDPAAPDADPLVLPGEGAPVLALAVSGDARWLAAGRENGTVTLWDLAAADPLPVTLPGQPGPVTSVAFGGTDRPWLATAGVDGYLQVRDLGDRDAEPATVHAHDGLVRDLAFSSDGSEIVTGGGDDVARVWNSSDLSARPLTLSGHDKDVVAVAFSPVGRTVATASADGTARLWDLARPATAVELAHRGGVSAVAFSADGAWLATGSEDHLARLWDLRGADGPAADPVVLPHDDVVLDVVFSGGLPATSRSSRWLATASRDGSARLVDMDRLLAAPTVLGAHEGPALTVAFADDRWLVTGGADGTARLWDLRNPVVEPTVLAHGTDPDGEDVEVSTVAFSPDGDVLATGAGDNAVRLWRVEDRTAAPEVIGQPTVPGFERAGISAVAYGPDGTLATGSTDGTVRLWNPADGAAVAEEVPVGAAVTSLAFDREGTRLAVAVRGNDVLLIDPREPSAPLTPLTGHEDLVTSVAFSPDGAQLATGGRDHTVRLWDLSHPDAEPEVVPTDDLVTALAFRPDGRQLAAASGSTVRRWRLGTGAPSQIEELGAGGEVGGLAYSPDGRTLLVGAGSDVELWDLDTADPAASIINPVVLDDHAGMVTGVTVSPDGRHFATASKDGTARLWLWLDALVDLGCRSAGRNLTQDEWRQLLPSDSYESTCNEWPPGR